MVYPSIIATVLVVATVAVVATVTFGYEFYKYRNQRAHAYSHSRSYSPPPPYTSSSTIQREFNRNQSKERRRSRASNNSAQQTDIQCLDSVSISSNESYCCEICSCQKCDNLKVSPNVTNSTPVSPIEGYITDISTSNLYDDDNDTVSTTNGSSFSILSGDEENVSIISNESWQTDISSVTSSLSMCDNACSETSRSSIRRRQRSHKRCYKCSGLLKKSYITYMCKHRYHVNCVPGPLLENEKCERCVMIQQIEL